MLIVASVLCIVSVNYLQKSQQSFQVFLQLFLMFLNCLPRLSYGFFNELIEIGLHMFIQDIARSLNNEENLVYKIILLELLGYFFSAFTEFSQIFANPNYRKDILKYIFIYALNAIYIFLAQVKKINTTAYICIQKKKKKGEQIRIVSFCIQGFIFIIYVFNYVKSMKNHHVVMKNYNLIYPMETAPICDQQQQVSQQNTFTNFSMDTFLLVNQAQVEKVQMNITKKIISTYPLAEQQQLFIMYYLTQKLILINETQKNQFKVIDDVEFKEKIIIPNPKQGSYLAHKSKPLLAIFSEFNDNQPGTVINVYDLQNGNILLNFGLTHKVTDQNSLHLFDSFQVDQDAKSDKIIFSHNKILCCLDIDSKNNEYLTENFQQNSLLLKANQRKIIVSGKDDFPLMFDVPTNQPNTMNSIFASYSKIIPIIGLNDFYFVQPACVKKMLYLMKGYGNDMKKIAQYDIGKPKIAHAIYAPVQKDIYFIEKVSLKMYKFTLSNLILTNDEQQFRDSVILLD